MLGIVKEINGEKKIIPLTTDTGTGAAVGTLVSQYKKVPMSGYLYCDGSTFDENDYPALYMYLGTNVLPDYRECVMVGAEQNTTDTIATHDVYGEGEFKDDQLQNITVDISDFKVDSGAGHDVGMATGGSSSTQLYNFLHDSNSGRLGTTTHGKQKAVYVYIKATSGLAENQQENVLNEVKGYVQNYLAWHYKVVSCAGGASGSIDIPAGYNGNYEYSVFDYKYHTSFHGIHITSDGTTSLGNIRTNFGALSNDGVTLNNTNIVYVRENTAGDFRIAFRPLLNSVAI